MGELNPLCTDAGEVEVVPDQLGFPYFKSAGIIFRPSDNPFVLRRGFTCFMPDDNYDRVLHKKKQELRKNGVVIDLSFNISPITNDPRILAVMHKYYHHGWKAPTRVPERLEAVNYLLKEKALYPLMPMEMSYEKNRPATLADLAAQGLSPESV